MQKYLDSYIQMISFRGLTDHTVKSYCTYVKAFLNYLDTDLHKLPEDVSWDELRGFILWLQRQRSLADRTMNTCISQLRFLPFMFFISPGILISFLCASLILICLLFLRKKK